jgi:hypothetical protein
METARRGAILSENDSWCGCSGCRRLTRPPAVIVSIRCGAIIVSFVW